ncbi:MAG TPA: Gfo/Idh/MocA family oxidoreductase [Chloroflexota bacterium]|nr:Gfo/Idh/MocA family oxidoreductase [Chloroflexota bacterium]
MSDRLKLALLGCGDVAVRDYLPELHRLADRVELVAVSSRTETRARAVAEQFGAAHWYTDYRQMLAESGADIVANLTPIQVHFETTLAALQAGKHVYSEKPVADSARHALTLRDEAAKRGLTLVCAPSVLLYPQVRYVRSLLADNAIGPVYSARGQGHGGVPPWPGFPSDPSPFFAQGGGPAVDMGVYPLHALTGLLGPVKRVMAMSARAQPSFTIPDGPFEGKTVPVEVDDNWHLVLDFGNRRLASVEASNCVQRTKAPEMELLGLQGSIAVNLLDVAAPVEVLRDGGSWEQIAVPYERKGGGPDHILGVQHLVDCVLTGRGPLLSAEHAAHVVSVTTAAQRSSWEGRAVEVDPTIWQGTEDPWGG